MKMERHKIFLLNILTVFLYSVSAFQIRLGDGESTFMGRVEVNLDDGYGWGTVCDDSWDVDDAKVACRSLNLEFRHAVPVKSAIFGRGTGYIHMDNVGCTGSEFSLALCTYVNRSNENCGHGEDAGVICWGTRIGNSFRAYIESPNSTTKSPLGGWLMLKNNGRANYNISVCSNNFGLQEARVACYELGHGRNRSVILDLDEYASVNEYMFRYELNCSGNEAKLASCRRTLRIGYCPSNAPVAPGIACNYEKVNEVKVYGGKSDGSNLFLDIGTPISIHCESDYARPRPDVKWFLDNNSYSNGVQNTNMVSNEMFKVKSTLTFTPTENLHGRNLVCCSEDATGYRVCSSNFHIYVRVLPQVPTINIMYTKNTTSSTISLICTISKVRPRVELKWYKNGIVANDSSGFSVRTEYNILKDDTFETKTVLTLALGRSIDEDDVFQCEALVDEYRGIQHVPIIFLSKEPDNPNLQEVSSIRENNQVSNGHIINILVLSLGIALLSVANVCLICRSRKSEQTPTQIHISDTSGRCVDNRMYTADCNEMNVEMDNYQQLQLPQVAKRKAGRKEEELYENTKQPKKIKKAT